MVFDPRVLISDKNLYSTSDFNFYNMQVKQE